LAQKIATSLDMAGRPPKGIKGYLVQLLPDDVERVDALVGTYKRSEFIRDAIARELARRKA